MNDKLVDDEKIANLVNAAALHISAAKSDYELAMDNWETTLNRFTGAFKESYDKYSKAIQQSEKLRKWAFDLCFSALTPMCGQAIGWVKAALMNNSEYYRSFCKHAFGMALDRWSGDLAKKTLHHLSQTSMEFKMPDFLNRTNPNAFENRIKDIFLTNRQVGAKALNDMVQLFDTYSGRDIIINLLKTKTFKEAKYAIDWEYRTQLRHYVLGSCYYYTHSPDMFSFPTFNEMTIQMERSMWAETFKGNNPVPPKWVKHAANAMGPAYYEAVKYLFYKPGSPVEARLKALGIMAAKNENKTNNMLNDFGNYTSDRELERLLQWAYAYQPVVFGGPFNPEWMMPPVTMKNYRVQQLRAVC